MRNTVVAFCRTYLTTSSSRTSCTERVSLTFCQPACFAHSLNNSANRNRKETCYSPSVEDAIVQLYSSAVTSTVWLPQQSTELQFKWTNRADASHANLWQGLPIISPRIFINRHHSNAIDHRITITTSHTTRHDRQTSRLHSNLSRPFLTTEIISISIFYEIKYRIDRN